MGWWWNSRASTGPASTLEAPSSEALSSAVEDSKQSLASTTSPQVNSKSHPTYKAVRDGEREPDLTEWLHHLESPSEENRSSEIAPDPVTQNPHDHSPDSLYATEMSCRSTFDYAVFCQSFGGQFVNVYRYGTFRSCSNHWDDLWLCMRTRQWSDEDRRKAIGDHNRKKTIKYKQGPSSEDVWKMRTEPVEDPFQGDLDEMERQMAEWKRQNPGSIPPWE